MEHKIENAVKADLPDDQVNVPFSEARANFTRLVKDACEFGTRAVITKFNNPVAAIVPIQDYYRLKVLDETELSKIEVDTSKVENLVDFIDESPAAQQIEAIISDAVSNLLENPIIQEHFHSHRFKQENILSTDGSSEQLSKESLTEPVQRGR